MGSVRVRVVPTDTRQVVYTWAQYCRAMIPEECRALLDKKFEDYFLTHHSGRMLQKPNRPNRLLSCRKFQTMGREKKCARGVARSWLLSPSWRYKGLKIKW